MNSEEIKREFQEDVENWDGVLVEKGICGAIVGSLDVSCRGKENRYLILKLLTGHSSSKDLSQPQWFALKKLVQPWKPEGGKWGSGNLDLERICNVLLNASLDQPGQMKIEFPEFNKLLDNGSNEFAMRNLNEWPKDDSSAAAWEAHVDNPKVQDENPF